MIKKHPTYVMDPLDHVEDLFRNLSYYLECHSFDVVESENAENAYRLGIYDQRDSHILVGKILMTGNGPVQPKENFAIVITPSTRLEKLLDNWSYTPKLE